MLSRRQWLHTLCASGASVALGCSALPAIKSPSHRAVQRVLDGVPTVEGAGVKLTRVIGHPRLRHLDPFILLDRFHSNNPADYIRGFPDHPHRGFETITVMLEGSVRHRDSVGNSGLISGGGIQWMTAGRGIVHSEMPQASNGFMSGFQFWLNLPAREKMRAPMYQDMESSQIPRVALSSGGHLNVIAGRCLDTAGAVESRTTAPTLATVRLEDDQPLTVEVPAQHTGFVFVHVGEANVGGTSVAAGKIAVLGEGNTVEVRAPTMRTGLVLAFAGAIQEPIVQRGPFVMNTMDEIRQAYTDYRNGTLTR